MPQLLLCVATLYNGYLREPVFLLLACKSVVTAGGTPISRMRGDVLPLIHRGGVSIVMNSY